MYLNALRSTALKVRFPSVLKNEYLVQSPADVFGFFYHAMPETGILSLEELHSVVRDVWLTRHDAELEHERAARRKGRPKSTKETRIEDIKFRDSETYRTGMGPYLKLFVTFLSFADCDYRGS
jgi:hypothetical protein